MKPEDSFNALINYLIFVFFKRIYDFFLSIKYPDAVSVLQENKTITIDTILIDIRTLLSGISITWLLYLVSVYKYNTNIYLLLFFMFCSNIFFFLIERNLIYIFIDKEKIDSKIIYKLDTIGGMIINIIFLFIYCYLIYKLFNKST